MARGPASPTSSTSTSSTTPPSTNSNSNSNNSSKLAKLLTRDRSRSLLDSPSTPSSTSSTSTSAPSPRRSIMRPGSRFRASRAEQQQQLQLQQQQQQQQQQSEVEPDMSFDDEAPVIVEPAPSPAPSSRSRSARPHSSTDLPGRLSGWFTHAFSTSHTDLSLPTLLANASHSTSTTLSPKGKAGALIRSGRGHIDRAMRYILDADATPDQCADEIWVLGVRHPGWGEDDGGGGGGAGGDGDPFRRASLDVGPGGIDDVSASPLSQSQPPSSTLKASTLHKEKDRDPASYWPPSFFADFTSRIWLTYRNQFTPIRDSSLGALDGSGMSIEASSTISSSPRRWNWLGEKGWTSDTGWGCMLRTGQSLLATALIHLHLGRDFRRPMHPTFTPSYATYVHILTWFLDSPSPACPFSVHRMALAGKDLGKDVGQWFGPSTAAGALRTLTQAFPGAGLGVALAVDNQVFESDVYAASNVPTPAHASSFDSSPSLASSSASPRTSAGIYAPGSPRARRGGGGGGRQRKWGGRAVLVLVGIRLGLDGVNPRYYETVKVLFTFPQSVGIAGGRPSSSYFFVGTQADSLFYLDPHHTRPAVPLRPAPEDNDDGSTSTKHARSPTSPPAYPARTPAPPPPTSRSQISPAVGARGSREQASPPLGSRSQQIPPTPSAQSSPPTSFSLPSRAPLPASFSPPPTSSSSHNRSPPPPPPSSSPPSARSPPPTRSRMSPPPSTSPSPLAQQISTSSSSESSDSSSGGGGGGGGGGHGRWHTTAAVEDEYVSGGTRGAGSGAYGQRGHAHNNANDNSNNTTNTNNNARTTPAYLTPLQEHLVTAYAPQELRTFHCERVRKLPLSGLDPSMLIGFLCRDEEDWVDLRRRIADLGRDHEAIFSVQDEHPSWPSDSDSYMGLESLSEPDAPDDSLDPDADGDDSSSGDGDFFDASEGRPRDDERDSTNGTSGSSASAVEMKRSRSGGVGKVKRRADLDVGGDGDGDGGMQTPGPSASSFSFADVEDVDDDEWVEPTGSGDIRPASLPTAPVPPEKAAPPVPEKEGSKRDRDRDRASERERERERDAGGTARPRRRKQVPVPVPFPSAELEAGDGDGGERRMPVMSTQRARDGGRTQSGGVKGILADE